MKKELALTNGKVSSVLLTLSLPMIAANFVQTTFGLIDMAWIGSLGSGAVSAVGTATFYLNLATALSTLITVGAGVKYAQSLGAKKQEEASRYVISSILFAAVLSLFYFVILFIFSVPLIQFYHLQDIQVVESSISFLRNSLFGSPFLFLSLTLAALLTSRGKTKIVFIANTIGLLINLILDPILIFGVSKLIPSFGIIGAAWATNFARMVTFLILAYALRHEVKNCVFHIKNFQYVKTIVHMGIPVALQRVIFIFISMYLARIIAQYGNAAIAAQKIGLQIESISYVTIGGLQGALAAFVGQNYGAKQYSRIKEGYQKAIHMAFLFSVVVTVLFLRFPKELFAIFINEEEVMEIGVGYMQAIGISQLFMCIEYITVGVFNGIGKTYISPIVSVVFTALRIPMAIVLSRYMGVSGIWWSISISSVLKGLILYAWMKFTLKKGGLQYEC